MFCDKQPLHHIQRHAFKMPKVKPAAASTVKKRTQYTVEMKNYAQQLHKDGLTNSQIRKILLIRFDALTEEPPNSTVSTWYNDRNMTNHTGMAVGPEGYSMCFQKQNRDFDTTRLGFPCN